MCVFGQRCECDRFRTLRRGRPQLPLNFRPLNPQNKQRMAVKRRRRSSFFCIWNSDSRPAPGSPSLWENLQGFQWSKMPDWTRKTITRTQLVHGIARAAGQSVRQSTASGSQAPTRLRISSLPWLKGDFAEAAHRFCPECLETFCQALSEGCVAHHERCHTTFRHKRVIHGQNHDLLVDNVEGVPELSGVSNAGDVIKARPVVLQKCHESGSGSIAEAENNTVIEVARGSVPGDAAQERRARSFGSVDCRDVALLHIGPDAILGCREMYQVSLHVALLPKGQVNEGRPPRRARRQRREPFLQALSFGCKPVRPCLRDLYEPREDSVR